jgi:hypothetical protein
MIADDTQWLSQCSEPKRASGTYAYGARAGKQKKKSPPEKLAGEPQEEVKATEKPSTSSASAQEVKAQEKPSTSSASTQTPIVYVYRPGPWYMWAFAPTETLSAAAAADCSIQAPLEAEF